MISYFVGCVIKRCIYLFGIFTKPCWHTTNENSWEAWWDSCYRLFPLRFLIFFDPSDSSCSLLVDHVQDFLSAMSPVWGFVRTLLVCRWLTCYHEARSAKWGIYQCLLSSAISCTLQAVVSIGLCIVAYESDFSFWFPVSVPLPICLLQLYQVDSVSFPVHEYHHWLGSVCSDWYGMCC